MLRELSSDTEDSEVCVLRLDSDEEESSLVWLLTELSEVLEYSLDSLSCGELLVELSHSG